MNPISPLSRRQMRRSAGTGFGMLAFAGLVGQEQAKAAAKSVLAVHDLPRPHFAPRAKRILFVFLQGSMSQMHTVVHQPELQKHDGKTAPGGGTLTASKFAFRQHGETGSWFSELFPQLATHADELCRLRGLHTDTPAHPQAVVQLHTGAANAALARPSLGAWPMYEPGSENSNLPGYVTINPVPNCSGAVNCGSAFLPARFQGTRIDDQGNLPHLAARTAPALQRRPLDLIQSMSRDFAATIDGPDAVDAVIESHELAFRMQADVPALLDISQEPRHVLDEYGAVAGPTGSFARQCVTARRLCDAGVRFVEICQPGWDHHRNLHATLPALLGLDHMQLTDRYAGRDFRLTDVVGEVATDIFADA